MSTSSPSPRSPGSHPISAEGKRRPWWLLALLAIAIVVVLLLVLSQCNGDDSPSSATTAATAATGDSSTATANSSATASDGATPSEKSELSSPSADVTTPASPTPSDSTAASAAASPDAPTTDTSGNAGAGAAGDGTLTAGSTTLLPASGSTSTGDLTAFANQPIAARDVNVLSVPADEGFWVGSSTSDRIWVQLSGTGESSYQVRAGDLIDFTGTMITHRAGFAARVGVNSAEGARQLTSQGAHIKADRASVQLSQR